MPKAAVNPEISAVRRAAALARWQDHASVEYRTVRIRADVLERLARLPGETWSARIESLLPRS